MAAARTAAGAVLGLRVAYGLALAAVPERLALRWLGAEARGAGAQVALRGLAAREIIIHAAALSALARGAPMGPWLMASAAGDLSDVAATLAGRDGLPDESPAATAVVAGGSAMLSLAVAAALGKGSPRTGLRRLRRT
jgi:hypothetical protein